MTRQQTQDGTAYRADIVIVGGGLAGSSAAVMLGRSDHEVVLVDPHPSYRPDFRCEKLDPSQMGLLRRMGLAGLVLPRATRNRELLVSRYGRLIDRMPVDQYGILYQDLVNAVRAAIPEEVTCLHGTASEIRSGDDRQVVTLSNGDTIDARLVVMANGLNWALRRALGFTCEVTSPVHSITIGFDVVPADRTRFGFDSLTYYGEKPADRTAYLTLFRLGQGMRANLMCYRAADDPWLGGFRDRPEEALLRLMPGLRELLGAFSVAGPVRLRPADLYVAGNVARPGIVLVGDAFATSCPAAGTGTNKVLQDVERLCALHVPRWLASDGMGVEKIAAFYADPLKQAVDRHSLATAHRLKSLSIDPDPVWRARRLARFLGRWCRGIGRRGLARLRALALAGHHHHLPPGDIAKAPDQ